jgi:hypothetical protein
MTAARIGDGMSRATHLEETVQALAAITER